MVIEKKNNYVRQPNQHHHHHHHQARESGSRRRNNTTMPSNRGKPTMEIYRPPNVRTEVLQNGNTTNLNPRLNVHAKEFTMKQGEISTSRSTANIPVTLNHRDNHNRSGHHLQQSKSSGNILHSLHHSKSSGNMMHNLQQSSSSGNILQGPRVHFQLDPRETESQFIEMISQPVRIPAAVKTYNTTDSNFKTQMMTVNETSAEASIVTGMKSIHPPMTIQTTSLKRSKSLGAADMTAKMGSGIVSEAPEIGNFPIEVEAIISRAIEDPNKVSARSLMDLVRQIMERAVSSVYFALPAAKLCITIIEKETKETFLESLLNLCQQWYQERDRVLKNTSSYGASPSPRFCAFMQFLNEMYCELKRRQLQLKTQYDGVPPGLVLLTLVYKCCLECVKPPHSQGETDSLFFVLTTIGRDLENELPAQIPILLASIRDAFLQTATIPTIKKTLLQLIELHASKWQLPAPAIMYYTAH
ncbi:hypothetical protein L9F63_012586 [Diploptera punctata]|uniref:MIF4G domain-containing protein n=1 Tax=Diploptera punctata TaxID=6984 RepID=A0AAD8AED9_DIPPU|nr:hypothetical protein L9F63_012586 [Diploptera punctata]